MMIRQIVSYLFTDIGQPAPFYLHMQVLNRWTFADRDAECHCQKVMHCEHERGV